MTRSIGDWTKSSWVLPQPELRQFEVPSSSHMRLVLATDGLWDIVSPEHAAQVTRAAPTPQQACDELLEICRVVYMDERGLDKMGDDTTVMIVELNPSERPFEPPPASCCAIL